MNFSRFFLITALSVYGISLNAQTDKMMFHAGFTYEFFTLKEKSPATDGFILPFYGLTGGMNYVLLHSNDQVSLLANPNVSAAYSGGNGFSMFMVQAPIFLSARYGAGATPYNEKRIGVGAGAGVNVNYLYSTGDVFNHTLFLPSAMAEVLINGRSSFYSIKVHWTLYPMVKKLQANDFSFSNLGVSINYSF